MYFFIHTSIRDYSTLQIFIVHHHHKSALYNKYVIKQTTIQIGTLDHFHFCDPGILAKFEKIFHRYIF